MMGEGKARGAGESETLEVRLEQIRAKITSLAKELEWRGHQVNPRKHRLVDHAPDLAFAAAGALLIAGATTATRSWNRRRNGRPLYRVRQVGDAVSRLVRHPERFARPESSVGKALVTAMLAALAATAARTLSRWFKSSAPIKA
jgi:hypothetical protein